MTDKPIGEIIESGTNLFVAQCLEVPRQNIPVLYDPPPLGAFVKICQPRPAADLSSHDVTQPAKESVEDFEDDPFASTPSHVPPQMLGKAFDPAIYALVYAANTASLEPNRRPSALGFADEDEMRREQPQIFELLCTEFSGLLIAYAPGDGKALCRHLPPRPPRIHSRVYLCEPAEVLALTSDLGFLRSVLLPSGGALAGVPSDELAAACLRGAKEFYRNDQAFLLRAGKALAALLADDYDRLQSIIRSIL